VKISLRKVKSLSLHFFVSGFCGDGGTLVTKRLLWRHKQKAFMQ